MSGQVTNLTTPIDTKCVNTKECWHITLTGIVAEKDIIQKFEMIGDWRKSHQGKGETYNNDMHSLQYILRRNIVHVSPTVT